jgi:hypothetical protein
MNLEDMARMFLQAAVGRMLATRDVVLWRAVAVGKAAGMSTEVV